MPLTEVTSLPSPGSALYKLGMMPEISLVFHNLKALICFAFKAVILAGIFCNNSSFFSAVTTNSSNVLIDACIIKTGTMELFLPKLIIGWIEEKLI